MGLIGIILLVLFVLSALILIILVLMQDEQGEGIGGIFGGGSSSAFGSRAGTVLTKFTSIMGAIFLFCSFGLAWVNKTTDTGDVLSAANRTTAEQRAPAEWWNAAVEEGGAPAEAPAPSAAAASDTAPQETPAPSDAAQ